MNETWSSGQGREAGRVHLDVPPPKAAGQGQGKRRRSVRIRVACVRCQRRKIRCDGSVPSCSSCKKAGVACIDGGKQNNWEHPRAYIASLKARIVWLESNLGANCPNINLDDGPKVLDENKLDQEPNENDRFSQQPSTPREDSPMNFIDENRRNENAHPFHVAASPNPGESRTQHLSLSDEPQPERLAHEIGLVSVTAGQDLRYVGPSSGYFLAKVVLASAGRRGRNVRSTQVQGHHPVSALTREAFHIRPTELPSNLEHAIELSQTYWETVHLELPFVHQPSHNKLIEQVYSTDDPNPVAAFQVNMVLAISTTVMSRRLKVPLSAEGFCVNAMKYFDKLPIEGSMKGLQCLLLLLVYAMHNPSMGLNVWYLNYECIAAVLDLGLQRDVKAGNALSVLTQEMRTRVFWSVYSLDRTLATMMGRPIGLRDEACDLRLPGDVDDNALADIPVIPRADGSQHTHMSNAIHLFKLSHLNSEIKYITHSISHKVPAHAYPRIPDIFVWQRDIIGRLQRWASEIPQFESDRAYITKVCEIKYHDVMMLLLRPSPAIRSPPEDTLKMCYQSAVRSIRLYDELYRDDLLVHSWATVHSVFLATITMLYCIWVVPDVPNETKLDMLMADLRASSNVLSATGEHWTEAKRSRDVLDDLSRTTIRRIIESRARNTATEYRSAHNERSTGPMHNRQSGNTLAASLNRGGQTNGGSLDATESGQEYMSTLNDASIDDHWSPDFLTALWGGPSPNDQNEPFMSLDINTIMQGVFDGSLENGGDLLSLDS